MQHSIVIETRGAALQSRVSVAMTFELTDAELAEQALSICGHHGLASDEAGPMLVAFNDLSADEFEQLRSGAYPAEGLALARRVG